MNTLQRLQNWYRSQCNEDWEHQFGVKIDNIDNPGWSVTIDLEDTNLETELFNPVSYGTGEEAGFSGENWLTCRVENNKFKAFGGPDKLEEILLIFLRWQESAAP